MKVRKVYYDYDYTPGCETCDYGSSFVDDFIIIFEDGEDLHIQSEHMYDNHLFSEAMIWQMIDEAKDKQDLIEKINKILDENEMEYILYVNDEIAYKKPTAWYI